MNYTPVETLESRVIIIAFMRAVSPVGGGRGRDADLRHAWQLALTGRYSSSDSVQKDDAAKT